MSKPTPAKPAQAVYLSARQVLDRYGRSSLIWLYRRLKEPAFPKPIYIGDMRFWRLAELEAYEANAARAFSKPLPMDRKALAEARAAAAEAAE